MLSRCMARTISIVGAGRVGKTLGKRLRELGWHIGAVVTQSSPTSRAAVRAIGGGIPLVLPAIGIIAERRKGPEPRKESGLRSASGLFRGSGLQLRHKRPLGKGALAPEDNSCSLTLASDVILIAVPDSAIKAVADNLAQAIGKACRAKVVLHTSGALDRTVLAPLARCGAATGSLHPLQTFSGRAVPQLKGVIFAVEGDPRARHIAQQIARQLGGVPVTIDGANKPAYHAAGTLVAGHALALAEAATQMLVRMGFTRRRAVAALLPLMRQTLENFERLGPQSAWTGPIARGDFAVVAKHGKALRRFPREFRESYAALSLLAGRVLSKNPATTIKQLKRALKNSGGGPI
jgi:predicted short-subunit dehydrogenase-like oxidoreductase (DUF2520 family)